ncbi:hypothetical protein LA080_013072 [Diaporthe eres]|uniref:C2H2-type domain-containing protein n=1 Tax=Diaporthe vaccinii TaxID=105482 RepID=A0ABR4EAK1_9PEZI|nr:hypothetical protein LA080_013072 [Diaporthe eres]
MARDPPSSQHIHRPFRPTKFKGLGLLRLYCTACSKQCRDENAFKQHSQSESHVRNIDAVSSNLDRIREQYSQQFLSTFLDLLRLNHGEKSVQANRFYQTYIADPHHVHLKDTRWGSLTRFAEWLGREGLCRFEEKDDGVYIAWIDESSEAERRAAALREKQCEDAADGRREERQLGEQVKRAHAHAKHQSPPSPTQTGSLGSTQDGDATVAFQFGRNATGSASRTFQPKKAPNIFRAVGQKRKRPVGDSAGSGAQGFHHKQPL